MNTTITQPEPNWPTIFDEAFGVRPKGGFYEFFMVLIRLGDLAKDFCIKDEEVGGAKRSIDESTMISREDWERLQRLVAERGSASNHLRTALKVIEKLPFAISAQAFENAISTRVKEAEELEARIKVGLETCPSVFAKK